MKLSILAGSTSQSVNIFIRDSSSTTGGGLTGLVFNTASLTAYYTFAGANATATAITLATLAAVNSAFSSGGFKEIDATNMPGWYRFDIPNAALATSKGRSVAIHFKGATNMAPTPLEIELTGWDNQDGVRGGMTALPNAAAGASGGVPLSVDASGRVDVLKVNGTSQTARDLGASVLLSSGTGTGQISLSSGAVLLQAIQTGVTIPTVTTVTNQLTAAAIATGVWQDTTAGDFTVASSIGKGLYTSGNAPGAASGLALVGSAVGAAASVTGDVGGKVLGGGAGTITGTGARVVDSSGNAVAPASTALSTSTWTGTLATSLTTLASHDPGATIGTSTLTQTQVTGGAYALNSASFAFNAALDFTTAQKAATLARVTLVDTTTTNTDMRGTNNALLAASYTAPDNASITAIKAKTDNLPASPAAVGSAMTLANGAIGPATFTVPADAAGVPTDPIGWLRRVYQRSFHRRTRNRTTGVVTIYAADDTTAVQSYTQSTAGDTDTASRAT